MKKTFIFLLQLFTSQIGITSLLIGPVIKYIREKYGNLIFSGAGSGYSKQTAGSSATFYLCNVCYFNNI